jgi:hypothetical protein
VVGFVVFPLEHFFWILVLSKSLQETVFLAEVYFFLSSLFHSFGGLLLGALSFFCIVCLVSFRVSSSISHFGFSASRLRHELWGGCWYIAVDTLSTRLT